MTFDIGESRFYKNDEYENLIGEINYSIAGKSMIIIDRTFVHDDYRGQRIAAQLVERVVAMTRNENKKIIPLCPFDKSMFEKNNKLYANVMTCVLQPQIIRKAKKKRKDRHYRLSAQSIHFSNP